MEQWDYLQLSVAMYINSDSANPALLTGGGGAKSSKPIRAFCQRLKGKQGRLEVTCRGREWIFLGEQLFLQILI